MNSPDPLSQAKANLQSAFADFRPLDVVRDNPLTSIGIAFAAGVAVPNLPSGALLLSLERMLNPLLTLALSALNPAEMPPENQSASAAPPTQGNP